MPISPPARIGIAIASLDRRRVASAAVREDSHVDLPQHLTDEIRQLLCEMFVAHGGNPNEILQ